jgi:predicted nucleotidyltransferase
MTIKYHTAHSHADREQYLHQVMEFLQTTYREHIEGIAVEGSYARQTDLEFSDIELTVLLTQKPTDLADDLLFMFDGCKVGVSFFETAPFLKKYRDVSSVDWVHFGNGYEVPLYHERFMMEVENTVIDDVEQKCQRLAKEHFEWEVHEYFGKLFNAILHTQEDFLPLIFAKTFEMSCEVLALLNYQAFPTYADLIKTTRGFTKLPPSFESMFAILAHGTFTDDDTFTIVTAYYNELVDLIEQEGIVLFESCSIHDYR